MLKLTLLLTYNMCMKAIILVIYVVLSLCNLTQAVAAPANSLGSSNKSAKAGNGWMYGIAVIYPPTTRTFTGTGKRGSNSAVLKSSFEFEAQPSFMGYAKYSKENSFGLSIGYEALLTSKLSGGSVTNAGTKVNAKTYSTLESIKLDIGHVGTEFRFKDLYIPVEFLYVEPKFKMEAGTFGKKGEAGTGYSIAAGYHLFKNVALELTYRSLTFGFREYLAAGTNPDYDNYGNITSNELTLSALFHL